MATYYFRNVTGNFNATTSWSLTSGGASAGVIPTSTDSIIFDANSGNCTVTANTTVASMVTTNHPNTRQLIINTNIVLTITANYTTWITNILGGAGSIVYNAGASTIDLSKRYIRAAGGNANAQGTYSLTNGGTENVYLPTSGTDTYLTSISGNYTINSTTSVKSFICTGYTNTLALNASLITNNNVEFSSTMTITASATTNTFTMYGGTAGSGPTFDTKGKDIPCKYSVANSISLLSNVVCKGLTITGSFSGSSYTVYVDGDLTSTSQAVAPATANMSTISIRDTSTLSGSGVLKLVINAPSKTVTIGNFTLLSLATTDSSLTYISGTVNCGTNTFVAGRYSGGTITIAASGINFYDFKSSTASLVLNETLNVSNKFILDGASSGGGNILSGSYGFNTKDLQYIVTAYQSNTVTLQANTNYNVSGFMRLEGNPALAKASLISSSSTSRANLILASTATMYVSWISATRIDSSGGITVKYRRGTITNTVNWQQSNPMILNAI